MKKGKNYNPYQYGREEFLQTGQELMQAGESNDCEMANRAIEEYVRLRNWLKEDSNIRRDIFQPLRGISKVQCPESFSFIKELIKIDTSEQIRCDAIMLLGQMRNTESIPFLEEYIKKENLSQKEHFMVIIALCRIGIYCNHQNTIDKVVKLLDGICYDTQSNIVDNCATEYLLIGGEPALKFFNYYFELAESKMKWADFLVQLGEHKKTFPVFVEAINSGSVGYTIVAMRGLAAIGTKKALKLIKEQTKSKNESIAKEANWIFKYIEISRGWK